MRFKALAILIAMTAFPWQAQAAAFTTDFVVDSYHSSLIVSTAADTGGNIPEFLVVADVTLDTDPPSANFDPPDGSVVSKTDLFIIAEYDEVVTPIEALFGLGGAIKADVLAQLQTVDNKRFIYFAQGLQPDKQYVFTINVEDEAGNLSGLESTTFTVRGPNFRFEIPVAPGWNLISLPGNPADPAINSVFDATNDHVQQVITTAKTQGLPDRESCISDVSEPECLSAQREPGGLLTGSLTTIVADRGYWVLVATFQPLEISIPLEGFTELPSSIPVYAPWDIVGVMTRDDSVEAGSVILADDYFKGTNWFRANTFETRSGSWTALIPGTGANVEIGKGYYLAVPADTNLIIPFDTFSCSNVSEIPMVECEALIALYNATDGPNWMDNSGWLETNTSCSWYGVTCDVGHVARLDLPGNQLSESIPAELGTLSSLTWLNLNSNQLSGSIPVELGNLSNLGSLSLGGNQLSGRIPVELGNLSNLNELNLWGNELSGSIPVELGNLSSLQTLSLHINQLTGNIPAELGNLSNLNILTLITNQLSGPLPQNLTNLNLRIFYFIDTALCEPPDAGFQTWLASIDFLRSTGVICPDADLSLTKEADLDPVIAGSHLTYTISVTNNSTSTIATGVKITDMFPPEVSFEFAEECNESAGIVTCELGDVGATRSVEVTFVVTVDSSATDSITNTATVEGDQFDLDFTNNSDTEETAVIPIHCTLNLSLGYADGTLTMDFELGTREPATWNVWLVMPGTGTGVFRLWSFPIPFPITPPTTFPISFPLPDLGTIGFLTALSTSERITCIDVGLVDTGGEVPTGQSIEGIRELFPRPNGVLQES